MGDTFVQWSIQSKKLHLKGNRANIPNFSYSQMLYFSLAKIFNFENLVVKGINSKLRLIKVCFTFHKIYFYYA